MDYAFENHILNIWNITIFFSLFLCEETVRRWYAPLATIFETVQWDNIIEPLMILCRSNYPHICYYSRWSRSAFVYTYIVHKARNENENIFEHMQKEIFFFFFFFNIGPCFNGSLSPTKCYDLDFFFLHFIVMEYENLIQCKYYFMIPNHSK